MAVRARRVGLAEVLRELRELRRVVEERLPARVPSFREFARAVLEEYWKYWRLGGGFVRLERLREAVCSRLLIPPQVFDVWFGDLVWAAAGRLSVHESRDAKGATYHVFTQARTVEELLWGR